MDCSVWFLGVRKVKRTCGLQTDSAAGKQEKSDGGEITEHVTIRLMVCQGYIRINEGLPFREWLRLLGLLGGFEEDDVGGAGAAGDG
jgi:hypothetical protein